MYAWCFRKRNRVVQVPIVVSINCTVYCPSLASAWSWSLPCFFVTQGRYFGLPAIRLWLRFDHPSDPSHKGNVRMESSVVPYIRHHSACVPKSRADIMAIRTQLSSNLCYTCYTTDLAHCIHPHLIHTPPSAWKGVDRFTSDLHGLVQFYVLHWHHLPSPLMPSPSYSTPPQVTLLLTNKQIGSKTFHHTIHLYSRAKQSSMPKSRRPLPRRWVPASQRSHVKAKWLILFYTCSSSRVSFPTSS